ncbi:Lachesin [Nymphon striatum]|nr:Lachesin [Nymphon striatum]
MLLLLKCYSLYYSLLTQKQELNFKFKWYASELPEFAEPMHNVTVSAGRDVKLACVIKNLGDYKVAWTHLDTETLLAIHNRIITKNNRYSVLHNGYHTWWLHIRDIQPRDSGLFMCQINTSPMMRQTGYIQVLIPPQMMEDLSSKDVNVHEGEEVNMRCAATGHPRPTVSWVREDDGFIYLNKRKEKSFEGQDLNFTKVSRVHMGAYLCMATNGVAPSVSKRMILSVSFPPMVTVPNLLVGALRHHDITLECDIEAFPSPMMYWRRANTDEGHRDETMLVSNTKYNVYAQDESAYKYKMKLIIYALKEEDYGKYVCHAKSSYGDTKSSIKLYEIQNPSISPKRMQSIKGGHDSAILKYNEIREMDDESYKRLANAVALSNSLMKKIIGEKELPFV